MPVWKRELPASLTSAVDKFIESNPLYEMSVIVTPEGSSGKIQEASGANLPPDLVDDMARLVDMFCYLFDISKAGLRLAVLDRAMCPRFHVDRVPCRLVSTYRGVATDWLLHADVDRTQLGPRSHEKSDLESGLYKNESAIQRLDCGDVALLKGELWMGNAGGGLVHRSPTVADHERRLLLTLDFCV